MNLPQYLRLRKCSGCAANSAFATGPCLKRLPSLLRKQESYRPPSERKRLKSLPTSFARLEVELEHGLQFPDANVTNNHPLLTGKDRTGSFKETLDYYLRLEVAELEGDMLKALSQGDSGKLAEKFRELIRARAALCSYEAGRL